MSSKPGSALVPEPTEYRMLGGGILSSYFLSQQPYFQIVTYGNSIELRIANSEFAVEP